MKLVVVFFSVRPGGHLSIVAVSVKGWLSASWMSFPISWLLLVNDWAAASCLPLSFHSSHLVSPADMSVDSLTASSIPLSCLSLSCCFCSFLCLAFWFLFNGFILWNKSLHIPAAYISEFLLGCLCSAVLLALRSRILLKIGGLFWISFAYLLHIVRQWIILGIPWWLSYVCFICANALDIFSVSVPNQLSVNFIC